MKFHTCSIYKENQKGSAQIQITFDEDYNLPDYKPDISSLITKKGTVLVEETKVAKGYVLIKGMLKFQALYRAEQNSLGFCSTAGSLVFQEKVFLDAAEEFDTASVACELEDLSIHITNSRKLSVRGLVQVNVVLSDFSTALMPCRCEDKENAQILIRNVDCLQLAAGGKDQCRVHEEVELPANRLNIQDVIWSDLRLESVQCTSMGGWMQIKGELSVFCLYQGEPGIRLEWYEGRLPIVCKMEVEKAEPDSICYVKISDAEWNLQVQADLEGENRVLAVDGVIKCQYRIYREMHTEMIQDIYALDKKLLPVTEPLLLERMLVKNDSRCKVSDTIRLEQGQKDILQILNCTGEVQVDHQEVVEDGIWLEGIVQANILYMTQDDTGFVDAAEGVLPFQYKIEAPGIHENCRYELDKELNMISVMMRNSNTLELQALLDFHVMVFEGELLENITDVKEEPAEMKTLLSLPGITGVRVKNGDTLWSIAKANHTTCETIRQNNTGVEEPLKQGQILLLLKEIE